MDDNEIGIGGIECRVTQYRMKQTTMTKTGDINISEKQRTSHTSKDLASRTTSMTNTRANTHKRLKAGTAVDKEIFIPLHPVPFK